MSEAYYPYRQLILSRDELRELSVLTPLIAVRATLWNLLLILAAWSLVAVMPTLWTTIAAISAWFRMHWLQDQSAGWMC